jgi:SAM-dependent methyltransferase
MPPAQPCLYDNVDLRVDAEFLHFWTDQQFDSIYPRSIQNLSCRHWTPVEVCRKAAQWLVTARGTRVLDVGCGPGKFCIVAAASTPGDFTGVEQRAHLASIALGILRTYGISRVRIITANVTNIRFSQFDAFYIFNPFEENVLPSLRIDDAVELQPRLYAEYSAHVSDQLALTPPGTRVVTYCGDWIEIPDCFECAEDACAGQLKLWIRSGNRPSRSVTRGAMTPAGDMAAVGWFDSAVPSKTRQGRPNPPFHS